MTEEKPVVYVVDDDPSVRKALIKPFDEQSLLDAVRLSLQQAGRDESRSPAE